MRRDCPPDLIRRSELRSSSVVRVRSADPLRYVLEDDSGFSGDPTPLRPTLTTGDFKDTFTPALERQVEGVVPHIDIAISLAGGPTAGSSCSLPPTSATRPQFTSASWSSPSAASSAVPLLRIVPRGHGEVGLVGHSTCNTSRSNRSDSCVALSLPLYVVMRRLALLFRFDPNLFRYFTNTSSTNSRDPNATPSVMCLILNINTSPKLSFPPSFITCMISLSLSAAQPQPTDRRETKALVASWALRPAALKAATSSPTCQMRLP